MDALELIRSRRSTRKYLSRPVEEEKLLTVLEAGRYAPSGSNSQTTHLIVLRDPEKLARLADTVRAAFCAMEAAPGMYASFAAAIRAARNENYIFHYNAPVLIVTANRADYGNNMADCACVLENMMLMANALDLGSCWINQLRWLNEDETLLHFFRALGLEENERIYGALSLGYPDTEDGLPPRTPLPRTGNPVTMC